MLTNCFYIEIFSTNQINELLFSFLICNVILELLNKIHEIKLFLSTALLIFNERSLLFTYSFLKMFCSKSIKKI